MTTSTPSVAAVLGTGLALLALFATSWALSYVPLAGYAGQISLCQLSMAGIGAMAWGQLGAHGALWALAAERFSGRIAVTELPLVRWTLTRLGDDSRALIWVEHHVVHDGWSFAATVDGLTTMERAVPPLPV